MSVSLRVFLRAPYSLYSIYFSHSIPLILLLVCHSVSVPPYLPLSVPPCLSLRVCSSLYVSPSPSLPVFHLFPPQYPLILVLVCLSVSVVLCSSFPVCLSLYVPLCLSLSSCPPVPVPPGLFPLVCSSLYTLYSPPCLSFPLLPSQSVPH